MIVINRCGGTDEGEDSMKKSACPLSRGTIEKLVVRMGLRGREL
jgi:hypothetical protein